MYATYLWCSEGLSGRNQAIVGALSAHAKAHGAPFACLGDWNNTPDELAAAISGLLVLADARPGFGTCCQKDHSYRTTEYGVADSRCATVAGCTL